jgi:hypothetical protein
MERTNELSKRMYERNIPSEPLKSEISFRPEQTKFTILGKEENYRDQSCEPRDKYANYEPSKIFNPGNGGAPWYGYASNINNESTLRNQFFALQKCDQATTVNYIMPELLLSQCQLLILIFVEETTLSHFNQILVVLLNSFSTIIHTSKLKTYKYKNINLGKLYIIFY